MAKSRTRTVAAVIAVVVLVLGLAAAGFGGGRYWRSHHAGASAGSATVTITPTPTPGAAIQPAEVRAAAKAAGATSSPAPVATGAATGAAATRPAIAAKVAAAFAPALANPDLGPSVHAFVVDGSTGRVLYQRTPTTPSAPASTNKLLTATAVLATIPAATRFTTRAVAGAKPGSIVLVGGGDPTLSAARPGRPTIYASAGRLSDLAAQVRRAMPGPITSVVVDASLFSGPAEAPGWAPDDVPSNYASAIAGLVVDGGRPATGGYNRSAQRSGQPAAEAGRAFASLLGRPTLPISAGRAPAGAKVLGTVRSAPVLELIEQALRDSDNTVAEMLSRHVALVEHQPASFAGGVVGVRKALKAIGVAVPATLYDGSGLSVKDRLPASVLVRVLRAALTGPHSALHQLITALPVAGWDGTLAGRYRMPPSSIGAGEVRAKTGTLTSIVNLAGTVRDRAGRILIFAVMTDRASPVAPEPAEAAIDAAAARLAGCVCS